MEYRPPRPLVDLDKFYGATGLEREKIEEEIRRQNSAWYRERIRKLGTDFIVFGVNSGEVCQHGPGRIPNHEDQRKLAVRNREPVLVWAELSF